MNLIIVSIIFIALVFGFIGMYNRGISLKNYVEEAFSTMDVYMKKRWDLIPNLVETAKGYMTHERETLEKITALRNQNYSSMNNEQKIDINSKLDMGISKLIASVENYPDLKANQAFLQLMNDLSAIEDEIANSRKYYNGTVRELNNYTEYFPSNIVAMISSIKPQKMFQIEESQRENIKVQF